ncbi:TPA: hypothetical protein EYP66_22125 [Candidatus Poribacteria bacterium]|nr:hypothetical protein [Candidatus Poribacteria bacterium]
MSISNIDTTVDRKWKPNGRDCEIRAVLTMLKKERTIVRTLAKRAAEIASCTVLPRLSQIIRSRDL